MPRAAELVFNTRFNGRAVQQGLAQTKSQLDSLGNTIGGKLSSLFAAAFSAEKLIQFAKAIDAVADRVGKMVDKLREGKDVAGTLQELEKTGVSQEQAGFADAYSKERERFKVSMQSTMLDVLRVGVAGFLGSNFNMQRLFPSLFVASVTPQKSRVARAVETGNTEADRLATIKWIQENEADPKGQAGSQRDLSFMNVPPVMDIQRQQLKRLDEIANAVKYNRRAAELLKRTTMFPQ